jgi:hypothetical protein
MQRSLFLFHRNPGYPSHKKKRKKEKKKKKSNKKKREEIEETDKTFKELVARYRERHLGFRKKTMPL